LTRLERTPEIFADNVGEAFARCDEATRKRLATAAAASNNAVVKKIAMYARIRNLPPKLAAQEILATVPENERANLVRRMNANSCSAEMAPLLIELLPEPRIGAKDMLREWA